MSRARSALYALASNAALPASTLITAPMLAQGLGVAGRGEVAAVTATYTLLVMLASAGIPDALTYFVAKRMANRRGLALCTVAAVLLSATSVGAAYLAAPILSGGSSIIESLILGTSWAVLPSLLVAFARGAAAGNGRWGLIAIERAVTAVARIAGLSVLLATGTVTSTTASWTLVVAMIAGGLAYVPLRVGRGNARPASGQEIAQYAARVWLGAAAGVLLSRVDQILMVPLSGSSELGLYAVAVNIGDVPLVIVATLVNLMLTADARRRSDGRLALASRITTALVIFCVIALGATCMLWIPPLFGEEFAGATIPAIILLSAVIMQAPGSVAGAGLSARGTPQGRSYGIAVACVVNVGALAILAPAFGAVGAAVATFCGLSTGTACNLYLLRRWHAVPVLTFLGLRRGDLREGWDTLRGQGPNAPRE